MARNRAYSLTVLTRVGHTISIRARWVFVASVCLLPTSFTGCQRFSGNQAFRQYQLESDRLLNEFRAQKKRADELENRNVQLEQRLAESEKQLALSGNNSGRRSGVRSDSELLIGQMPGSSRDASSISNSGSSRSNSSLKSLQSRTGLPDVATPIPGQFASGSSRDPISLVGPGRDLKGDRNRESQWRPIAGNAK